MLVGAEVDVERVDQVEDLLGPRVLAVDLVDHQHRRQPERQRLGEHEAGLGERPLGGVHQQQHAVHQPQRALHLAAEVGVAGGVNDVDLDSLPGDGGVLGEDGDALLALEVVRVHDPVDHGLVGAEDAGLAQHVVNERGLAVVHVGDDCDVADFFAGDHGLLGPLRADCIAAPALPPQAGGLPEADVAGLGRDPGRPGWSGWSGWRARKGAANHCGWCRASTTWRSSATLYLRDPEGNRVGLSHHPEEAP